MDTGSSDQVDTPSQPLPFNQSLLTSFNKLKRNHSLFIDHILQKLFQQLWEIKQLLYDNSFAELWYDEALQQILHCVQRFADDSVRSLQLCHELLQQMDEYRQLLLDNPSVKNSFLYGEIMPQDNATGCLQQMYAPIFTKNIVSILLL